MFDEKPVVVLALVLVVAHAHEHPTSAEALAFQPELEIAFAQHFFSGPRAFRHPITAVPQLHRAAAIFALRDGSLEVSVIERVILYFDREPLVVRIERWALRHRPRLEDAIEFQP
jgi:hypothetical protein